MTVREDTFELRITGAQTYEDLAVALEQVAREVGHGNDAGTVTDADGVTIGEWKLCSG